MGVRRVIDRLGAKDVVIELQLDRIAGDAEILEAGAEKGDRRHVADEGVLGDGLAHDAVGRQHLHHIEPFHHRGGQGVPALARLGAMAARDMGIGGAEGDDRLKPVSLRALVEVAALLREFRMSLGCDLLRDRKV